MEQYSGAEALLEVCNANDIETIFFNPGGEFAALNAAVLKYHALGKKAPGLKMCLHESVAMTAAHGHYMVSGKPQLVLVHSELGTQQTGGAVHNAQWGRIPVVLMAGVSQASARKNWKGEPYDQGMLVRNCVKWDYQLSINDDIQVILSKAIGLACSEPRGPVYLCYDPGIMTKRVARRDPAELKTEAAILPPADPDALNDIAETILAAERPLIVAGYTERYPENVRNLIDLAESFSCPVVPGLTRMNFPTTHPLCAGMEEMGGGVRGNEPFAEADVVLVIDYDTPYVPAAVFPSKAARILQIDSDPLTAGRPLWGRGADLFVKADSRQAIPALTELIRNRVTESMKPRLEARRRMLEEKHRGQREARRAKSVSESDKKPISADWVGHCISELLDEDTILVNHLISQSSSINGQVDRSRPGTLLACAGGSIMWALGAAFGAKAAAPEKTVISVLTDGGFVWGCPVASLWSSSNYSLPFLTVIFDNRSYGAIRTIIEQMSETPMTPDMGFVSGIDISPPADYARIAESCGGYGEVIEDPSGVKPALRRALEAVRNGRPAVVDVRLPLG